MTVCRLPHLIRRPSCHSPAAGQATKRERWPSVRCNDLFCVRVHDGLFGSFGASLRDEFTDDRDKLDGHFHHGVRGCLICRLVLGDRFLIGLRPVVVKNAPYALLVPANGIL